MFDDRNLDILKISSIGIKFPTITQKAESNGLSHLVRDDRPRIICIEKGGRIWPGKDQVAVSIVLKPPKMEDEISETVKEIDKTGLNLHDSDPPIECPPSHTPGPAGDVGAQKSSETHKGQGIINQLSEEITLPVSGILQKIRDRRQDLLRTLRQPRQVVTWKMTDRRPSSVEPRILGVGDTVVLNGREFIDLRAGGIPLLAMRCWGERLEDVEGGEASEPSAAA